MCDVLCMGDYSTCWTGRWGITGCAAGQSHLDILCRLATRNALGKPKSTLQIHRFAPRESRTCTEKPLSVAFNALRISNAIALGCAGVRLMPAALCGGGWPAREDAEGEGGGVPHGGASGAKTSLPERDAGWARHSAAIDSACSEGRVGDVLEELRRHAGDKTVDEAIGYFENNRSRMRYPEYRRAAVDRLGHGRELLRQLGGRRFKRAECDGARREPTTSSPCTPASKADCAGVAGGRDVGPRTPKDRRRVVCRGHA